MGYAATFVVCWIVLSVFWCIQVQCYRGIFVAPVAPLFFSGALIGSTNPAVGVSALLATTVAGVILVRLMWRSQDLVVVACSHILIVVYWLWTFQLCRTGL